MNKIIESFLWIYGAFFGVLIIASIVDVVVHWIEAWLQEEFTRVEL